MSAVAMTGDDVVIINNRNLNDFADGDIAVLDFEGDIAAVKKGKNGNAIYALNTAGLVATLVLKLVRGGADDQFLNGLQASQNNNFAGFTLMIGEMIKKIGDGSSNITNDTYILSGGVFIKGIPAKSNVEGDTAQNIAEYRIRFSNAPRTVT